MNINLFHYVLRVHSLGVNSLSKISGVQPVIIDDWVHNRIKLRKNHAVALESAIYKYLLQMKDTSDVLEVILDENQGPSTRTRRKRQS